VDAVVEAYRAEKFWGVRVEMAAALAAAGTQAAIEALAELIGEEQDGMVIEALIRSAGSIRAVEIRSAIEARLDAGLGLYRATLAAHHALGAQRGDAPMDRLKEAAAKAHDPYGLGRASAFRALAATRNEDAIEVLAAHTAPGTCSNRSRQAAVTSLGAAGRWLEPHKRAAIGEQLEDLLRDPIDRIRGSAAAGLMALGEPSAIGPLETYKGTLSDQDAADIDRMVAGLRAAASAKKPTAKDEAADEMRKKLRKLEDALEKLTARVEAVHGKLNDNGRGDDEKKDTNGKE